MTEGPTKDLVLRLRAIRDELGLSIADIQERLEAANTPLAESTIRRVFDHDMDSISGFNYDATLMPLSDLLLPKGDVSDSALSASRIDGLLAVIEIKNEMIESITKQFQEAKAAYENERRQVAETQAQRCKKCEEDVSFLKKQISLKDERMDKKDEWIDRLLGHIEEMLHSPAEK